MSLRSSVSTCTHDRSRPGCSTAERRGAQLHRPGAHRRARRLAAAPGRGVSVAYEAGPTGFGLARACAAARIPCLVAAPAASPGPRRARQDRPPRRPQAGQAAAPRRAHRGARAQPAEEAARDLVRAREDARADLMRARHRLSSCSCARGSSGRAGLDAGPRALARRAALRDARPSLAYEEAWRR